MQRHDRPSFGDQKTGGGAIILQLGDFMNDTFGPNSEKGAMEYQNLVHLWPFKKKIRSQDVRSHDF